MRKIAMAALLLFPVGALVGQSNGTEVSLGLAELSFQTCSGCSTVTQFMVTPIGARVGFHVNEKLAVEPGAVFWYAHASGQSSTSAAFSFGVPYAPKGDWGHTGLYVEPEVAMLYSKESGSSSQTRFGFGGEVGGKGRVSDHVSIRLAAVVNHVLSKDNDPSYTTFGGWFGLSIFFAK